MLVFWPANDGFLRVLLLKYLHVFCNAAFESHPSWHKIL